MILLKGGVPALMFSDKKIKFQYFNFLLSLPYFNIKNKPLFFGAEKSKLTIMTGEIIYKETIKAVTTEGIYSLEGYVYMGSVTKNCIDFDVKPYVDFISPNEQGLDSGYKDYIKREYCLETPEESFLTLLGSSGISFESDSIKIFKKVETGILN